MIIEDGKGTGFKAQVNLRHQLVTSAVVINAEADVALRDDAAFSVDTGVLAVPASFSGPVLLFENLDPDRDLVMASISLTADAALAGDQVFVYRNPLVGTLANQTEVTPLNINFESNQRAAIKAYKWDGVGTAGIGGLTVPANSTFGPFPLFVGPQSSGAPVVMGQGSIIAIGLTTIVGSTPNVTAVLRFYFDTTGED